MAAESNGAALDWTVESSAARAPIWLRLLIALLAALPFTSGLQGDFVFDDVQILLENPDVADGGDLGQMLTAPYLAGDLVDLAYWRPLASLTLWCTWQVSDGDPFAFKLVSLGVHFAAVLLAFELLRVLLQSTPSAAAGALLFAVSPLQVESVSWISALNVPLHGVFAILSMLALAQWRRRGSKGWPLMSGAALLLALLSRETALTTLGSLLALDVFVLQRRYLGARDTRRASLLESLRALTPHVAAVALYVAGRMAVYGEWQAGFGKRITDYGFDAGRLLALRFETLGGALREIAWPLNPTLYRPVRPNYDLGDPYQLVPVIACVVALALMAFAWARRAWLALFALASIACSIAPLGLALGAQARHALSDRMLYMPTFGAALLVVWALSRWLQPKTAAVLLILPIAFLGVRSFERAPSWNTERELFATALADNPNSVAAAHSLGVVLLDEFRATGDRELIAEAHQKFLLVSDLALLAKDGKELDIVGRGDVAQASLALTEIELRASELEDWSDYSGAIGAARALVENAPQNHDMRRQLGVALIAAGRYDEGIEELRNAIELRPDVPDAYSAMGRAMYKLERFDESRKFLERALEMRPGNFEELIWTARANAETNKASRADELALRAAKRNAESPEPETLRGFLALKAGDPTEALERFDRALRLDAEHAQAHDGRAKALMNLRQPEEALAAWTRACDFGPKLFGPHYNVASMLLQMGLQADALPYLRTAYELSTASDQRVALRGQLVNLMPNTPDAWFTLAQVDERRGEHEFALEWVERALALRPDGADETLLQATLLRRLGRPGEALPGLERLIDKQPASHSLYQEYARALVDAGRSTAARGAYETALELIASDPTLSIPVREALGREIQRELERIPLGPQSE